jgi:hypothetical protein
MPKRNFVRVEKWVEKPLPPPEPEWKAIEFTKITIPLCFYAHVKREELTKCLCS